MWLASPCRTYVLLMGKGSNAEDIGTPSFDGFQIT